MGFPIRKSTDQRVFAPPRSLSQRITSFIACACQGIHQLPLRHLIVLIADAHLPTPEGMRVEPEPVQERRSMVSAQKDQLLEISPGVRLGKPIICGRLSVSPRQTTALRPWSLNKSSLYDVNRTGRGPRSPLQTLYANDQISSQHQEMVEPDGIEPTTSCLQSRRSPS